VDEPSARNALLAFGKLNYREPELCLALSSVCLSRPAKQERVLKIMSCLWGLAVLNVYEREAFEAGAVFDITDCKWRSVVMMLASFVLQKCIQ